MAEYRYMTKLCKDLFRGSTLSFDANVPRYCPICKLPQAGSLADAKLFSQSGGKFYGVVMFTCNSCEKKYLANFDIDSGAKQATFGGFYPTLSVSYENKLLAPISPRFISLYEQALRAETAGDLELAGTGYRNALECLVKDYAIIELGRDSDEVAKKSLCAAIGEYLETDMATSADVVRILGNDMTHYERKHPNIEFDTLKDYMEIFIDLVQTKVRIRHPPVSR